MSGRRVMSTALIIFQFLLQLTSSKVHSYVLPPQILMTPKCSTRFFILLTLLPGPSSRLDWGLLESNRMVILHQQNTGVVDAQ